MMGWWSLNLQRESVTLPDFDVKEPKSDEPVKEEAQDTTSTILHSEEGVSKPEEDVAAAAVQAQESSDVVALPETDKEPAVITEPEQPATTESQESVATGKKAFILPNASALNVMLHNFAHHFQKPLYDLRS